MLDLLANPDNLFLLVLVCAVPILLAAVLVMWRMSRKRQAIDRAALAQGIAPDAAGEVELPVRGTHTRAGFLQGAHSSNSLRPRFWIERDAVRIKILRTWHLPFQALLQIDAREPMTGGMALIFQVAAARRAFVVRFGHADLAREALARIPTTVPLTRAAAILRDGDARAASAVLKPYRGPLQ